LSKKTRTPVRRGTKAIAVVSAVVLIMALGFISYKLFRVRHFSVNGCDTLKEASVVASSGIEYDDIIFCINKPAALESIGENPMVKPVSVDIDWPDTVVITIEERKPAAYVVKEDALIVIDDEGYVLEVLLQTEEYDLVQAAGLQISRFQIGERLGAEDTFRLDVLSRVLKQTADAELDIARIDVTQTAAIRLETADGLTIEMGDDMQIQHKMQLAMAALDDLGEMVSSTGVLDVASGSVAYYREN
jgi:cell division protein FtsQ